MAVNGKLKTTSYEKDGHKFFQTKIIASSIQFLDAKIEVEQEELSRE